MKTLLLAVLVGGLLASVGCASPVSIPVVFAEPGSYAGLGNARVGTWDVGEVKSCDVVSAAAATPHLNRNLLLCGTDAQLTWEGHADKDDRDDLILEAKSFAVTFHDAAVPAFSRDGETLPKSIWSCQKTADGIECHLQWRAATW
jgi:hypothetical protein